jgi:glycosyltransferase involved in cell wall biosynthesis
MSVLRPDVWIIVPAFNEGTRLRDTLDSLKDCGGTIVVVDDGSADQTYDVALSHGVWALRHVVNRGQGAALKTGIDFALNRGAQILVTFDADGQHGVADLERIVQPVRDGAFEVVLGSRFRGETIGLPFSRRLVLWAGVWFTRIVSGLRVTDTHNGFRAFSRRAAEQIRIRQDRMAHGSEILDEIQRCGLSYCEAPVTIRYTPETLQKGQSSWNALKIVAQLFLGRVVR